MGRLTWRGPKEGWTAYKDWLKSVPGTRYLPDDKEWAVPEELKKYAYKQADVFGVRAEWKPALLLNVVQPINFPKEAKKYQVEGALKLAEQRRWIVNFEMGLGKTMTAILGMRLLNVRKALIVCPAGVRGTWIDEIAQWWPGHPEVGAVRFGRQRTGLTKADVADRDRVYAAPIQIVSYTLLDEIDPSGWDMVVIDEAHRIKNPDAQQSITLRNLVWRNPNAAVAALTGTLIPNEPKDIFHLVHTIWRGRFSENKDPDDLRIPLRFLKRYTNRVEEVDDETGEFYGVEWTGLNQENAQEFAERIAGITSRVTKAQVANELPPFIAQLIRIPSSKKSNLFKFKDYIAAQEELTRCGAEKVPHVIEWAKDAFENGAHHIVVFTHLKASAKQLAELLFAKTGVQTWEISGNWTPEERNWKIKDANTAKRAIIVATMQSVEEGINGLANYTPSAFAELHYSAKTMTQVAARTNRLNSKEPADIKIFALEGTFDELIAKRLLDKLKAINQAVQPGDAESKLEAALGTQQSEEDYLDSLNTAAASYQEDAY